MVTRTNRVFPGRIYIALGPWHLGDFRNIFLPNVSENQKKSKSLDLRKSLINFFLLLTLFYSRYFEEHILHTVVKNALPI